MIHFLLIKHILVQSLLPLQSWCRILLLFVSAKYLVVCVILLWLFINLIFACVLYILTCKNLVVCGVVINRSLHNHIHNLFENNLILLISIAKVGNAKSRKC